MEFTPKPDRISTMYSNAWISVVFQLNSSCGFNVPGGAVAPQTMYNSRVSLRTTMKFNLEDEEFDDFIYLWCSNLSQKHIADNWVSISRSSLDVPGFSGDRSKAGGVRCPMTKPCIPLKKSKRQLLAKMELYMQSGREQIQ